MQTNHASVSEEQTGKAGGEELDEAALAVEKEKIPFTEKVKKVLAKIKELWATFKETYSSSKEKATQAKEKLQDTKRLLKAKVTKRAFQYVKEVGLKMLKHIRPRKVEGKLTFGMEQPDQTGKTLGYLSIGCAVLRIPLNKMNIIQDFEKKVLDGYLQVKGKILLGIVLVYLVKLYFNRDVKRVMKSLGK